MTELVRPYHSPHLLGSHLISVGVQKMKADHHLAANHAGPSSR
jgi:hypothetical protein